MDRVTVRFAAAEDRAAILGIHEAAFGSAEGPVIVTLVTDLLDDITARPLHSLVAEADGRAARVKVVVA